MAATASPFSTKRRGIPQSGECDCSSTDYAHERPPYCLLSGANCLLVSPRLIPPSLCSPHCPCIGRKKSRIRFRESLALCSERHILPCLPEIRPCPCLTDSLLSGQLAGH